MSHPAGLLLCAVAPLTSPLSAAAHARWTTPRTPDGQPDLQGVWLSNSATPLERPTQLAVGDGVFQAVLTTPDRYTNPNATHSASEMVDLEFDNRTSLITDPADGRPTSCRQCSSARRGSSRSVRLQPD